MTMHRWLFSPIYSGMPFHRVLAVDADSDSVGEIQYHIIGRDADNMFQQDSSCGLLYFTERPSKNSYCLNIRASDNGTPQKSSNQIVEIAVGTLLTGYPKFTNSVYRA